MKCIHCGRISRARERTRGRCPECGHRFAFDLETYPGLGTDAEFKEAIDRVSGGGRLWFTARQLWLAANGRTKPPAPPPSSVEAALPFILAFTLPLAALALLGGMPGLLFMAVLGAAIGTAIGLGAARDERWRYALQLAPRRPFHTFVRFQLQPWLQVHGGIPGLLWQRGGDAAAAPPEAPADMASLAVDRAVVTDRWAMAQMLVANGFHTEHRCAVLSRDGYPAGMADAVKEMLRRNPRLTVFALHDASPDGCRLPLELRGPEWFPDPTVRVVDLGLRPGTVRRLRLPSFLEERHPPLDAGLRELLPSEDRRWLDMGHVYELAALPSAELMRAACEGMVAAGPNDGSGGTPAYDDAHWAGVGAWFGSLATAADAETVTVAGVG